MADKEAATADSGEPVQSQPARFRLNGAGRNQGILLLYPDKLVAVESWAELCGTILGPIVFIAATFPFFHDIGAGGSVVGILVGGWIGQGTGKRLAARKVADGTDGMMVIPLDLITSLEIKSSRFRRWVTGQSLIVTTADGSEYEFRGKMDGWQTPLADALTVRGRDVHVTPQGVTVTRGPRPRRADLLIAATIGRCGCLRGRNVVTGSGRVAIGGCSGPFP